MPVRSDRVLSGVRCWYLCVLTAALVCAASRALPTLGAQGQQPTFRSRTDLVEIDVVALDAQGRRVMGLTKRDFTLYDRRRPQTIATFAEFSRSATADEGGTVLPVTVRRDVAGNQQTSSDRIVVLVVDDLHIYAGRTNVVRRLVRTIVSDLGPHTSLALLTTSATRSVEITQDPSVIVAAANEVEGKRPVPRPIAACDGRGCDADQFTADMRQYKTLQDAARMLGGDSGRRKAFILISEGIGKDLSGLFGTIMVAPGDVPQGGLDYAVGNTRAPGGTQITPYHVYAVQDMMEALRRSDIVTYAIDPRGLVTSEGLLKECFPAPTLKDGLGDDPCSMGVRWESLVRQAQSGLQYIADATGGFATTNTNDLGGGVGRMLSDLDHYYMLGFYPSDRNGKGYRGVQLEVDRPGVTLRYRRGYQAEGAPAASPANRDAVAALAAGALPSADLPLRLFAAAAPAVSATAQVSVALEADEPPGSTPPGAAARDEVTYEVMAVDEAAAKIVARTKHTVTVPLAGRASGAVASFPVRVDDVLNLAPGHYQLRAAFSSGRLHAGGSVYLSLEVPDVRAGRLALGDPVLGYATGASPPAAGGASRPLWPFPPTLDRTFQASDVLRLFVPVARAEPQAPIVATVEAIGADGRVVRSGRQRIAPGAPAQVSATLALTGLAPGAYVLHVTGTDGAGSAQREVGFVIRP
jgi:VWFA-related protein